MNRKTTEAENQMVSSQEQDMEESDESRRGLIELGFWKLTLKALSLEAVYMFDDLKSLKIRAPLRSEREREHLHQDFGNEKGRD